jgi:hypothetical protein
MTSTIDTTNTNILKKLNCLKKIYSYLEKNIVNTDILNNTYYEIENLFNNYSLDSAIILSEYFSLSGTCSSKEKEIYNKLYQRFIKSNNIASRLDIIYNNLNQTYKKHISKNESKLIKEGNALFSEYTKIKIHDYIEEVKVSSLCDNCNEIMVVINIGEQSCSKCGICKDTVITVIDDDISNENKNIKYGSYDPSKHCRYWLDRIQGREIFDMTELENIVEFIKEQLVKDRIKNMDYITYNLIRNYLHKNNYSSYNEHIPLIRKLITGVPPPQLTEIELQKINIYFIRVIKLYNSVKPSTKINCPYHPYIIYKILEQILLNGNRKSAILKCIHLQSNQTLIQNDKLWKKICTFIPEFTYTPTDRNRE